MKEKNRKTFIKQIFYYLVVSPKTYHL